MSNLRPECGTEYARPALSDETALFLIEKSVDQRKGLIHGRLHGNGGHCAMGCFWRDNPDAIVNSSLLDEVATVNDSLGPNATPRQRWNRVRSWLRLKLRTLAKK